ncbi:hypothetical protein C8J57DRAFT_1668275 [Mycena rebaudengoi]|nr:hypothetical protein C8J57DRAFT_1668275 [Mycena rebaudengoi]
MSSPRRLSLHTSALSDAEFTLFTASFADLADISPGTTSDWDAILRLFSPATSLNGGAFFAALRLILHAQAGQGVDRSLAFVQSPAPDAAPAPVNVYSYNPFLPTPAPSPEAPTRPPLPPRKPTLSQSSAPSSSRSTASSTSSSDNNSGMPSRKAHAYSNSLSSVPSPTASQFHFSPPTHPLRRASLKHPPPSPSVSSTSTSTSSSSGQHTNNPFIERPPPPPPRRASSVSVPTSPFLQSNASAGRLAPRSADPRTTSFAASTAPPLPSPRSPATSPPVHPHRRASFTQQEQQQQQYPGATSPSAFDAAYEGVVGHSPSSPFAPSQTRSLRVPSSASSSSSSNTSFNSNTPPSTARSPSYRTVRFALVHERIRAPARARGGAARGRSRRMRRGTRAKPAARERESSALPLPLDAPQGAAAHARGRGVGRARSAGSARGS